jgi:carbon-monoxide dehydrogenase small subunit
MSYHNVKIEINGVLHQFTVKAKETLLDLLRERLGLTGTKKGCDMGECGACTVLIDGKAVNSCLVLAVEADGKNVLTIEGLANGDQLHPLQKYFIENHGLQCGYCTPGVILAAKALLDDNPNPTEQEIRQAISGHLCRCGTYPKIVRSVHNAARAMRGD